MTQQTLLFTGGGGAGTEAVERYLGDRYRLLFADAAPEAIIGTIPPDRCVAIPRADDPAFLDRMQAICAGLGVDVIVPGVDEELILLAGCIGAPGWPRILSPSETFVRTMLDKLTGAQAILSAGLSAPRTVPLMEAEVGGLSFPLIAKPRSGRGSRGVMVLDHAGQLPAYATLHGGDPDRLIAQALFTGTEYTVFVCADDTARLRAVIPVRVDQKRGVTIRAETDTNAAIVDYSTRFQAHFRERGIYNIQCILTDDGQVMPFEVNPRVSTTFCLGIATGFDPFAAHVAEALYVPDRPLRLRRNWLNDIAPV